MKYTYSHGVYKDGVYIITLKEGGGILRGWWWNTYVGDPATGWIHADSGKPAPTKSIQQLTWGAWSVAHLMMKELSQHQVPSDQGSQP